MITIRDLMAGFQSLPIRGQTVIAHGSMKAFGKVQGGPRAVIDALIRTVDSLVMPAFTTQTMVTPEVGPPNNALDYGAGNANPDALPFARDLPPLTPSFSDDPPPRTEYDALADTLLRRSAQNRTTHPILSFAGHNAGFALERQTLYEPFAPIGALSENNGWILLMGVEHTANTSIHYGERLAGRKGFVRWALSKPERGPARIFECPSFPGDSTGFNAITESLEPDADVVTIGEARVQAIRLNHLLDVVQAKIQENPLALLCEREDCARCNAVRESI